MTIKIHKPVQSIPFESTQMAEQGIEMVCMRKLTLFSLLYSSSNSLESGSK